MCRALVMSTALHLSIFLWAGLDALDLSTSEMARVQVSIIDSNEFERLTHVNSPRDDLGGSLVPSRDGDPAPTAEMPFVTVAASALTPKDFIEEVRVRDEPIAASPNFRKAELLHVEELSAEPGNLTTSYLEGTPDVSLLHQQQRGGRGDSRNAALTSRQAAALQSAIGTQLKQCWNFAERNSVKGAHVPVVTLRWRLNSDGTVDGEPEVKQSNAGIAINSAAERAIKAVKECQPYKLDQDDYYLWNTVVWDFFEEEAP